MTRQLTRTGIQDSTYERPEQAWVCGWAADGQPCRVGPDPKGRCIATAECTPHKTGDRWYCARPAPYGGRCQEGPLPEGTCAHPIQRCQPQRSWRAKRRRLTMWTIMATAGFVALLLGGSAAKDLASPGPLATVHRTATRACTDCHAPSTSAEPLLSAALLFQAGTQDSSRCLVCHQMGEAAGAPHGVDPAWLKERHQEPAVRDGSGPGPLIRVAALVRPRGAAARGEMACATCHQEHQGRDHAITAMADRSCQVCHQVRFGGFPDGHPEFGRVKRRHTGMTFDHQTHKDDNFGDAEFTCARCHQEDSVGRAMVLKPFALTCAGCHNQGNLNHHGAKITAGTPLIMIQLPLLTWAEGGHWSENAGVAEEELPPLIHLLLAGDDAALEPLRSLANDADGFLADWEPDDAEMKAQFEATLKRLVRELVSGDEAVLRIRVGAALGAAADAPEVATFVEQLGWSRFAMRAYQRAWLPGLGDGGTADASSPEAQGWRYSSGDVAVVYRAIGHADPLLGGWIDALAMHAGDAPAPDDDAAFRADIRRTVFATLASKERGGYVYSVCLRCHSVEQTARGPRVNWGAAGRETQAAGYAKFSHGRHLIGPRTDESCFACHQLKPTEGDVNLDEVSRAFMPHRKAQCLECHSPGQAQQQCLTCHEYHLHRTLDMMPAGAGQPVTLARRG